MIENNTTLIKVHEKCGQFMSTEIDFINCSLHNNKYIPVIRSIMHYNYIYLL